MNKKGMVQLPFTNITEKTVKILLREGFVENIRKHRENDKYFLVLTLRYRRNRKESYKSFLNLKRISTKKAKSFNLIKMFFNLNFLLWKRPQIEVQKVRNP
uniref:Ribosomal protein S8 n=1 Tax=Lablab purpureus TaxID=35936 RepID=A0A7T0CMU5_LABPU|nr:ribosomal protein S8 [Lablab purpureus]QPJ78283.1 ribosomal protein S8 [Lablab purpureus]